ncbi:putative transcriptional regulator, arsR family [Frankia canadensis]|uniref:Putative transcriptional regulator, arsR family n=1 Tax=Frankia canadensis TaxID=1836972 RepID=A0A2I2KUP3_9ACTN|nr:helix-turn-helix domain-containing protein [Frankia canadensis]SNQ49369.1 putative transcriptional regulator, arsR family [Frankia canadensis]SOU56659.1 putative transcriptional regulator, arsR family [Frankia canadensis]
MSRQLPQPSRDSIDLVTVLAALADPVRLTLLRGMYASSGLVDCATVASGVDVSPPTVSHHYRVLREAGLTTTVAEGRRRSVTIRHDDLEARFPGLLAAVLTPTAAPGALAAPSRAAVL